MLLLILDVWSLLFSFKEIGGDNHYWALSFTLLHLD